MSTPASFVGWNLVQMASGPCLREQHIQYCSGRRRLINASGCPLNSNKRSEMRFSTSNLAVGSRLGSGDYELVGKVV